MERRTALTAAAAVTLTVAAGALAVAANLGILGTTAEAEPAGGLDPVVAPSPQPTEVETVYVDETIHVRPRTGTSSSTAGAQSVSDQAPPVSVVEDPAPTQPIAEPADDAEHGENEGYGSDDHYESGGGGESHEYEGWDQDD